MIEVKEEKDLEVVRFLWDVLNRHHMNHSKHFSMCYAVLDFDHVKENVYQCEDYRLEIVYDNDKPLGFILGSINHGLGDLCCLYLYDDLRGKGLGSYLVHRMKIWFETKGIEHANVIVPSGSENLILFFKKQGFKTSKFVMSY